MQTYLREIYHIPLLELEREIQLGQQLLNGDHEARYLLIRHNLRLVIQMAKKYSNGDKERFSECVAEGNLGLIRAAETFDQAKFGCRFSTHATFWIRHSLKQASNKCFFAMRLRNHARKDLNSYNRLRETLQNANPGMVVSFEEVAPKLKLSKFRLLNLRQTLLVTTSHNETSLTGHACDESWSLDAEVSRYKSNQLALEDREELEIVMGRMHRLTPKEKTVLYALTGMDHRPKKPTLRELATELGKSHQTVQNYYNNALNKLREA